MKGFSGTTFDIGGEKENTHTRRENRLCDSWSGARRSFASLWWMTGNMHHNIPRPIGKVSPFNTQFLLLLLLAWRENLFGTERPSDGCVDPVRPEGPGYTFFLQQPPPSPSFINAAIHRLSFIALPYVQQLVRSPSNNNGEWHKHILFRNNKP